MILSVWHEIDGYRGIVRKPGNMKKIILILAGALCLSVAVVNAQNATQRSKDSTSVQPSQAYVKDMVRINATEIPASLRSTLQESQYKGWENAAIYRSKNSDMYLVEMRDENDRSKTYRFDANGKLVKDN
ncbi:MAG: hypothetical protein C0490_02130 [Marivirga sp.]|nr:hypothetical protein [Marivirga sp.]